MNRYLTGAFAPLDRESTEYALPVEGRLPDELDGLFTQIGPAPAGRPRRALDRTYPWFMQDGMVSGVRLRQGEAVWFRNRWVRSRRAARALGEPPAPGPRHFPIDTVNTNVVAHHGVLLALVESGCLPVQLTETLDSVRYTDLGGQLPRGFAAHPKVDPATGELHALAYSPLRRWAEHVVVSPAGRVIRNDRVDLGGRPLLHDIALTPRHVVFLDLPVRFDLRRGMAGRFPYHWSDRHQARIGMLPRSGGPVRWIAIDPGFVYHLVGAEEAADGGLLVRGLRYERLFDDRAADPLGRPATLWEWHAAAGAGHATARPLHDRAHELPRSDPRLTGRPHRYYYAVAGDTAGGDRSGLLRFDLHHCEAEIHDLDPGVISGELVFVPRTADGPETDGWLLHFRTDLAAGATALVVREAADLAGDPVAVVDLPVRVPAGAHSSWIAAHEWRDLR
ncbi:carotenoid oxygenase family protein [Pseudosporangium ferrugineum]|uniref:Dioxygenase n=1 Tax=Pseudosporangium ferrugineum TaxID=439699 RepID=A0A2T0SAM9_9ACTN|nr:carotenoid oxygenase family protein [Pseudosporangium ferrugineum]PRY30485.1 carotenoid cleavage dioxygenase [Pseudosporangium ferrugineum]